MYKTDAQDRVQAAYKLLSKTSISRDTLEEIRTLIKGINPRLDKALGATSKAFSSYEKITNLQVIELTAENLSAKTEKQKKRKKALLLLINGWNNLKSEVKRVQAEIGTGQESIKENVTNYGRIIAGAKGPLGLITVVALIIAGTSLYMSGHNDDSKKAEAVILSISPTFIPEANSAKGIIIEGKKVPLTEFRIGEGAECGPNNAPHYHAANDVSVKAVDGSTFLDPGGCGFGKVKEVSLVDIK